MSGSRTPEIVQRQGVTVVSLGPDYENLDEQHLEDVKAAILDTAADADPPAVVIDLSHTSFFGSAFIEILFRAWNRLSNEKDGRFAISGLTPYCREVLEVTHLNRLWSIYETAEEAVENLAQSS